MSRPPGLQRLVREQRAARLRSPRVPESMFLSNHINWAVIRIRFFRRWLSGSQRLKGLMSYQEISSRFRLTKRETFLLLILQYSFILFLLFG